jgi:hypothetical protein
MLRALAAGCMCLLAVPATAHAEWHITPMIGVTLAGKTSFQDLDKGTGKAHPALSISGMWLSKSIFGVEAFGHITPRLFENGGTLVTSSRSTVLMGNLVVTAPRKLTEYFLRPFASGGFGLLRVFERAEPIFGERVLDIHANLAGFNIGGGAIGFLTQDVGVRFEFRYFGTLHATDRGFEAIGPAHLRYTTASVGVVIRR